MSERIYYSREAEMYAQRERSMMALVLLGLGLSIGAIIALLFAPHSGEETRQDISDRMEPGVERAKTVTHQTVEGLQKDLAHLRDEIEARIPR